LTHFGATFRAIAMLVFSVRYLGFYGRDKMAATTQQRLHELCSQVLEEKDPTTLIALLTEINDILRAVLSEVNRVMQANEYVV
jgi:hypothetical protein